VALPLQILIVDDEEQLAENLKTVLGRGALDVRIAADADAAITVLESFVPDLVVLDCGLPGSNFEHPRDRVADIGASVPVASR